MSATRLTAVTGGIIVAALTLAPVGSRRPAWPGGSSILRSCDSECSKKLLECLNTGDRTPQEGRDEAAECRKKC